MAGEILSSPQNLPMEAVKVETAMLLSANGATTEPVSQKAAVIVGNDQPDLFDSEHSPFGAPVRLIITAGDFGQIYRVPDEDGDISIEPESFAIVDIRDVARKDIGGSEVRFVGGVRVDDEDATHLLVGKTFGDPESPYKGFMTLRPGINFDFGRKHPEMEESFGISQKSNTTVSGTHGRIRVIGDGDIAVSDFKSTNGTKVTTRTKVEARSTPVVASQIEAVPTQPEVQTRQRTRVRGVGTAAGRLLRSVIPEPSGVLRSDGMGGTYRRK